MSSPVYYVNDRVVLQEGLEATVVLTMRGLEALTDDGELCPLSAILVRALAPRVTTSLFNSGRRVAYFTETPKS